MLKVLIADDETLARETIKLLLKRHSDVSAVFEAENGAVALQKIEAHQPNLIFLDIQMPGENGVKVASKVPKETAIIFATAYDQYAIKAFDINAIDYLLKPFDDERFDQALNKARTDIINKKQIDYALISQYIDLVTQEQSTKYVEKLIVKDAGRMRFIDVDDISYIIGAGNYADIYFSNGSHILHRETLSALESALDPDKFTRIHRSTIVKNNNIVELKTTDSGDYTVILNSGTELTLSRRNKAKIKSLVK